MKKKIFLSEKDKAMPVEKLAQIFNISVSTAMVAKKRGWFYQGFRDPKFKDKLLPPRRKTKFKKLIHLTDEDRRMSISQIARKFNISATAAGNARKNGWIAQKLGPSINALPDGKFPNSVLVKDVIADVDKAACWVFHYFGFNKQEMDDVKQEIMTRLLEQTAVANFVNPNWRRKFGYYAGVKYITRKVYPYNRKFPRFGLEEFEEYLSSGNVFFETAENNIDYRNIISRLSLKDGQIVEKWAQKRRSKRTPPQKVKKILNKIQNRHLA